MAEDNLFELKVITPERVFFEGQVSMVEFNTTEGELGILKGHIPLTVIVDPGILTITTVEGPRNAALHAGFAEILPDKVTILAELVEWPSEIDEKRAEAAKERAEERLAKKGPDIDVDRATVALKKAICRLNVLQ
ncbi:MAG: ATP synthase F1 subunit epsilon [Lachnospiraceae bacterium]|nr:ATP synthase F1 subunit epsilon [Lachnospiraceae bacterium]